jgi:colanic acid biosynthesis glycosyl transferase WcaI
MRINVWGINYAPEPTGIGVYTTGFCDYLAARGHDVTMVTAFPYYPGWRKRSQDCCVVYRVETIGRVEVQRCWQYVPARPTVVTRIIHEASFVLSSFLRQMVLPGADVYVVVSPPLPLGFAASLACHLKRAPFLFHVQDLQPDAAIGLGMIKQGLITRLLSFLERHAYKHARVVSVIGRQMAERLQERGVPDGKIFYFPNWVELPAQDELPAAGIFKKSRDIEPDTPLVAYAGTFGVKQGLDVIMEAARQLKGAHPVQFVLAGDGACKEKVLAIQERHDLDNVHIEGVLSDAEHTALLVDSDICLVTQRPGTGASFLPSKLLKILALGRPIVTNADTGSSLGNAVAEGKFGLVTAPQDASAMASAIVDLLADEDRRRQMGEAGRRYVLKFEKEAVLANFAALVEGMKA